ncbi:MAG TPA: ABC transporter substrate-binding protein [Sphingomicrobium sp.]|jgi:peptide/nickel transport system substrate-binding protein
MRHPVALLLLAALALAPAACRKQPEGALKVVVIGEPPSLRDPAAGPLSVSQEVLLANVAQGLVRLDAGGNVVSGLAERWTVTDDGLSYIFRLASSNWPDGRKITAQQVARLLKRQLASRSKNDLKDAGGAIQDIVAMTDRVIEINLAAPRPNLLYILAQPEFAILRDGVGTGPFTARPAKDDTTIGLSREIVSPEDESATRQQVLLGADTAADAIRRFVNGDVDLVLGGTFVDLPYTSQAKLPRGSLRFDPASGLFGLVPLRTGGPLDTAQARLLLSETIDRDAFVAALSVPGLAPRVTLLEPGLEGIPTPVAPNWSATPYAQRLPAAQAQIKQLRRSMKEPTIKVALPDGPGADLLYRLLQRDWGSLGFTVDRVQNASEADFLLIDEVAPSASPSWFARHFRCTVGVLCNASADELMDAARQSPVPAQRYALYGQAAAMIDADQLFIPITAPVRWSLVSQRVQNFAGNRYARHTLTDLEAKTGSGG